ncbi:Dihydropteroate synthase [Oligella ureolytica]|uniref:Dihydropteroate synthase n=1 Tax=Oligella ureolytica TaxID=90244 RepID=A0A378XCZ7_9BURK|nr:dihydropteroate synthase [Oligella ureolytica]QPT40638.1 dihydropteroate synthase [Oligella ureolytica]SUA51671.1 Dihydropteroate synthase [Oligella ureolytica]
MSSSFTCGRYVLDLSKPLVMGIVNVTPDSFSDGGAQSEQLDLAIEHGLQMVEEGAHILDIGGESTRPGSDAVSVEEELRRIIPVIKGLRDAGVPLSIDTFKPEVMQAALDAGADMINDIYALRQPGALEVVAKHPNCGICVMHMDGEPKTMQLSPPNYDGDITAAVKRFLEERADVLLKYGVNSSRVMLDPGFCFGKTVAQNYQLLNQMAELTSLNLPLLVGLSRKSMIGAVVGKEPKQRVVASVVAAVAAAKRGAAVLRVHDVVETLEGLAVSHAIHQGD